MKEQTQWQKRVCALYKGTGEFGHFSHVDLNNHRGGNPYC